MLRELQAPAVATAPLVEVFVSVQGEGCLIGRPTLFVRTAGCPLRCTYCDTKESYRAAPSFEVRHLDGRVAGRFENPTTVDTLCSVILDGASLDGASLDGATLTRGVSWLSLTGGEPTLHQDFGVEVAQRWRASGRSFHLESAADDVGRLRPFVPWLDSYAMDYKLGSTLSRAPQQLVDQHLACLDLALASAVPTTVKVVVTPGVGDDEWFEALDRLRSFGRAFVFVLQPLTPTEDEPTRVSPARLLELFESALAAGFDARLLPQIHPLLGLA
ncbi:MAG TPA: 7-carboxy-7-deazaguanine synthase QueE [Planctomycetota bacterium]|nr:7-carboxy-7-deazaguanine synthase QueE [Planctomycetota bacterium]